MRDETIYDIMRKISDLKGRDWMSHFKAAVLGTTILTKYNNRTYRIDDVAFDLTPENTFKTEKGDISYINYYRDVSADTLQISFDSNTKINFDLNY